MPIDPEPGFPAALRPAWRRSDPASRTARRCDALDEPTDHQRLATRCGDYWVCARTGQMTRDNFGEQDGSGYDDWWRQQIGQRDPRKQIELRKKELKRYEPHRRTKRLLEIGSGEGFLLAAAAQLGWQAEGNELSAVAAEHAERISGSAVHVGPIESIELEADRFDVILCNNVFEHLTEPRRVLCGLARAVRPGGVIYLQTLNGQSWSMWLNPIGWLYYAQGHLYVPTLGSMRHYFAAAGLLPVELRTHGFRSGSGDHYQKRSWLRRRTDKLTASLAARCRRGHRVEYLLRRPEGA